MPGWGRGTWGLGPWGQPVDVDITVSVTGVNGTSTLGSPTLLCSASLVEEGLAATSALGSVSVSLSLIHI